MENMLSQKISYTPIGITHSPYKTPDGTPIQPTGLSQGQEGVIEILPEYAPALSDIEGFSHLIIIYHFHLSHKDSLTITPYMDKKERGVFSTRGPVRPNRIGMSTVKLVQRIDNRLIVMDIDILDGTPILDIKPYVPEFDVRQNTKIGWLERVIKNLPQAKDDGRFKNNSAKHR
jgi:tRNA (adenine37-N6)-methyltransferase